jgi:hypothetical protein
MLIYRVEESGLIRVYEFKCFGLLLATFAYTHKKVVYYSHYFIQGLYQVTYEIVHCLVYT